MSSLKRRSHVEISHLTHAVPRPCRDRMQQPLFILIVGLLGVLVSGQSSYCSFTNPTTENTYDIQQMYLDLNGQDFSMGKDASGNVYYYNPCHSSLHCTGKTPSSVCQVDGSGTSFSLGTLASTQFEELSVESGFRISFSGGDSGRASFVNFYCSGVDPGIPLGIVENPSKVYYLNISSIFGCPQKNNSKSVTITYGNSFSPNGCLVPDNFGNWTLSPGLPNNFWGADMSATLTSSGIRWQCTGISVVCNNTLSIICTQAISEISLSSNNCWTTYTQFPSQSADSGFWCYSEMYCPLNSALAKQALPQQEARRQAMDVKKQRDAVIRKLSPGM